ncbi:MAG: radical SAM protein [Desulfobulbaceae bacterium]|nr:radical SAM protein [Desulfobulbaceae bacterium]
MAEIRSPLVIPLFIAHQGCPHRCVFCNQESITGRQGAASQPMRAAEVVATIDGWLARSGNDPRRAVQVAFYGGSFTALDRGYQQELLAAVQPYLEAGRVGTIRLSTRPDAIDAATVSFLRTHGVGVVELGVQAMDDRVLAASGRGHAVADVAAAFRLLREGGMRVGGQLMIGLPGETTVSALTGARALAALAPDFVRIYPTLVIRGSALAARYAAGAYRPLTLWQAVARCARLKAVFDRNRIPVVRMGLQPSPSLERDLLAGPYHPAFGELVLARIFFNRVRSLLAAIPADAIRTLSIASADLSIYRGQRNLSVQRLAALGLSSRMQLRLDPGQPRQTPRLL